MRQLIRGLVLTFVVSICLIGTASISVAQGGPFSAQIQAALRTFIATAHTWTATQTFNAITVSSCSGCSGTGLTSKYIVQGMVDAALPNAQFLGALATGIVKSTTTTGVLSIASAGTDYLAPSGSGTALVYTTGSITGLGGNFSTVGAFTTAITVTGNTTVTLPTSGTLLAANQSITLSGDASGSGTTAITVTNAKVNGVAYGTGPATDTTPVITAANTATYTAISNCTDSSGNHLNYTTSTHAFSCGTSTAANVKFRAVANFDTAGRYTGSVTGSGVNSFGVDGDTLVSGAAAGSAGLLWPFFTGGNQDLSAGSPTVSSHVTVTVKGTDTDFIIGLANMTVASTLNYTQAHIGFKITWTGSGTMSLYGTVADGTEAATSALTTIVVNDSLDLIFVVNGTASVDFYYRKNGGAMAGPTTLSTHVPSATAKYLTTILGNHGASSSSQIAVSSFSYER